ncbi:MAG: hypothetical protein ABI612_23925 [Betaproteobacteria bacterium]
MNITSVSMTLCWVEKREDAVRMRKTSDDGTNYVVSADSHNAAQHNAPE